MKMNSKPLPRKTGSPSHQGQGVGGLFPSVGIRSELVRGLWLPRSDWNRRRLRWWTSLTCPASGKTADPLCRLSSQGHLLCREGSVRRGRGQPDGHRLLHAGLLPPLSMGDFVICMGSSVSTSCGFSTATDQKVWLHRDSTFFHSGITGLINAVHNNTSSPWSFWTTEPPP